MDQEKVQPAIGEKENVYYAKSMNSTHGPITNVEHLSRVSTLASEFGKELDLDKESALAGLFHDFGKYSRRFQNVLCGKDIHINHAMPGAAFLYEANCCTSKRMHAYNIYKPIIEAILGHHDGLVSLREPNMASNLKKTYERDDADYRKSGISQLLRQPLGTEVSWHCARKSLRLIVLIDEFTEIQRKSVAF